jgi:hypothetical protein
MPVSRRQVGSLTASNILTVCANHHRELHFGDVEIAVSEGTFDLVIAGKTIHLARFRPGAAKAGSDPC